MSSGTSIQYADTSKPLLGITLFEEFRPKDPTAAKVLD